jgi:hypothetical protein
MWITGRYARHRRGQYPYNHSSRIRDEVGPSRRIPTETCIETGLFSGISTRALASVEGIAISSVRREACSLIESECGALYGVRPLS